jgi:hypothetical protein
MTEGRPRPGDIVVHRQVHSPAVFVLSRLDGPLEYFARTYKDAVDLASRFTTEAGVDAWYTTDERTFTRVAQHRVAP